MNRLLGAELFKLRKRLMTQVLGVLLVAIIVLLYLVLWAVTGTLADSVTLEPEVSEDLQTLRRALFVRQAIPFGLMLVRAFGTLFAIVLVAGAVGSEYSWGTLRPMLACAESRLKFLGAKLAAVGLLIGLGILAGLAASLATSSLIAALSGGADLSFLDGHYVGRSLLSVGRTVLTILPYVLIAAFASILGRSTLAGIAAGLGTLFLEGIASGLMRLAGGWVGHVPDYLLDRNADSLMAANGLLEELRGTFGHADTTMLDFQPQWEAALILGAYSVVALVAALILFRRRDVTA